MRVFLCEKPSQARDIARAVNAKQKDDGFISGDGVIVTWCIGHLLSMAAPEKYGEQYKRWEIELLPILPTQWVLEVTPAAQKQYRAVKNCLSKASEVIIATDADREGETIAREVLDKCHYRGAVQRLWLSALDETSIRNALSNLLPGNATKPLYSAGLGRARADWLVGMNLTRLYTCIARNNGVSSVISVGRVQTPTLALVVARDRSITNFRVTPYHEVHAEVAVGDARFTARWLPSVGVGDGSGRCLNKQAAIEVAQKVAGVEGRITKEETRRRSEPAPLPYDLSTLQQEASKCYAMGAQEVLDIAQALYEKHKATTYPRTDCAYLPTSQWCDATKIMKMLADSSEVYRKLTESADTTIKSRAWNDANITAHHAIIPNMNSGAVDLDAMSEKEALLFDMICRRYLAQFYSNHEYDQTVIEAVFMEELFQARGRITRIPGWHAVIRAVIRQKDSGEDEESDQALPVVGLNDRAVVGDIRVIDKQTRPPQYFTEGTLIAAMKSVGKEVSDENLKKVLRETAGIGTEATRAGIIETLLRRSYVERRSKYIVSTEIGRALIDALPDGVKDPAMTAKWEQELDLIAQGAGSLERFLEAQEIWVSSMVQSGTGVSLGEVKEICPDCGSAMRLKKGTKGMFWGCVSYPECKATLPVSKDKSAERDEEAHRGDARSRRNSKLTRAEATGHKDNAAVISVGSDCPKCKAGKMVQRTAKSGNYAGHGFLGCSRYPQCNHSIWP